MVTMDVPRLMPDRTVQWVRVTVSSGHVVCKDAVIRQKVEGLKPPGGAPTDDPEPDWTLAEECCLYMAARILKKTQNGMIRDPGNGVVP